MSYLLTLETFGRRKKSTFVKRAPLPPDLLTGASSLTGRIIHFDDGSVHEYGRKTQNGYQIRTWPTYRAWYAARIQRK